MPAGVTAGEATGAAARSALECGAARRFGFRSALLVSRPTGRSISSLSYATI
jgi:hypothetical protein